MFEDRDDAGRKLATALEKHRLAAPMVVAIPRGGVPVGIRIARELDVEFSILVSRKLPLPYNPEAGFGAVAEDGSLFLVDEAERWVPAGMMGRIIEEQKQVIRQRIATLRRNRPFPDITGRTVILVDDGIAMGSTMRAAIAMCRNRAAGRLLVAVPVAGPGTAREMAELVDELLVLETPPDFRAVAQVYRYWHDVTDAEVMELLDET